MGHELVGRRSVPVVLAGLEEDAVAGPDLLDRAAAALAEADALGYVDRLPEGWVCQAVLAPGPKCTFAAPTREGAVGVAIESR
jgi:hypothetical protein